jgi:hypothetical protein
LKDKLSVLRFIFVSFFQGAESFSSRKNFALAYRLAFVCSFGAQAGAQRVRGFVRGFRVGLRSMACLTVLEGLGVVLSGLALSFLVVSRSVAMAFLSSELCGYVDYTLSCILLLILRLLVVSKRLGCL